MQPSLPRWQPPAPHLWGVLSFGIWDMPSIAPEASRCRARIADCRSPLWHSLLGVPLYSFRGVATPFLKIKKSLHQQNRQDLPMRMRPPAIAPRPYLIPPSRILILLSSSSPLPSNRWHSWIFRSDTNCWISRCKKRKRWAGRRDEPAALWGEISKSGNYSRFAHTIHSLDKCLFIG